MSRRPSRRHVALVALALAVVSAACRAAAPVAQSPALEDRAIHRELAAANDAMAAIFNRGDYLGAARFYSDDAQIIGPDGLRVAGRAAVDRYWKRQADGTLKLYIDMYVSAPRPTPSR